MFHIGYSSVVQVIRKPCCNNQFQCPMVSMIITFPPLIEPCPHTGETLSAMKKSCSGTSNKLVVFVLMVSAALWYCFWCVQQTWVTIVTIDDYISYHIPWLGSSNLRCSLDYWVKKRKHQIYIILKPNCTVACHFEIFSNVLLTPKLSICLWGATRWSLGFSCWPLLKPHLRSEPLPPAKSIGHDRRKNLQPEVHIEG